MISGVSRLDGLLGLPGRVTLSAGWQFAMAESCYCALAFHWPKIIFLHDKHEELLVEKSSFILCTFVYPRCYGRLKYGKIQRTNGIQNIMYFTRVVTNERKFSWRGNVVGELFQGMKNILWKIRKTTAKHECVKTLYISCSSHAELKR